ncbi:MAG: protein disulfide isomerase family protein [Terriglobales bacterium]
MPQENSEKKQKPGSTRSSKSWRRLASYAVLVVAVFGLAYYLGDRTQHKYDGFAHCLSDRGVKMYGAWWCPHCKEQKEEFAKSFKYVPYVECGVLGDIHTQTQVCKDANIVHYPTWQFPPTGERQERVFSLEELSDRTGCDLP